MTMVQPRQSGILTIAVETLLRHRLGADGRCGVCTHGECRAAANAVKYLRQAGVEVPAVSHIPTTSGQPSRLPHAPAKRPGTRRLGSSHGGVLARTGPGRPVQ
jgi:hypothetical protein